MQNFSFSFITISILSNTFMFSNLNTCKYHGSPLVISWLQELVQTHKHMCMQV